MRRKFESRSEVDAYIAGDTIECLECGRRFEFLGAHLKRMHGIDADEYREQWGIPAMTPLAGAAYREAGRQRLLAMQRDGVLTYDHLPNATAKSKVSIREKVGVAKAEHSALVTKIRPGDHSRLPPGAKRADGRNADHRRQYQIDYRKRKAEERRLKATAKTEG
ncbi:hypothetical protein ASF61_06935 [Duganella sp. Leaf126]|uniref:MucR family transcriptional regulator n=1 Tax=Duganella sp. Leaf126 TaxID=1736266 RepID=UPI0006FE3E27|nr:MucR family transcriptional regulator [Duganella sp. Leaf126]KQQ40481.1 hypothetical protein ASF61_06935 [Duganella sp. Leaf126]